MAPPQSRDARILPVALNASVPVRRLGSNLRAARIRKEPNLLSEVGAVCPEANVAGCCSAAIREAASAGSHTESGHRLRHQLLNATPDLWSWRGDRSVVRVHLIGYAIQLCPNDLTDSHRHVSIPR